MKKSAFVKIKLIKTLFLVFIILFFQTNIIGKRVKIEELLKILPANKLKIIYINKVSNFMQNWKNSALFYLDYEYLHDIFGYYKEAGNNFEQFFSLFKIKDSDFIIRMFKLNKIEILSNYELKVEFENNKKKFVIYTLHGHRMNFWDSEPHP
ncbi:unnamed protein product [marine sediment metagenome]|uniref:Uncharacterized protein n=1 Tax=marine sediment metagenome TaxID=412755 RepID=X0Z9S7_9ZZZZ